MTLNRLKTEVDSTLRYIVNSSSDTVQYLYPNDIITTRDLQKIVYTQVSTSCEGTTQNQSSM